MPTYIIRLPDNEQKALLINLVGTLEKLEGRPESLETFDAIEVRCAVGHPAAELLRTLASAVIPDPYHTTISTTLDTALELAEHQRAEIVAPATLPITDGDEAVPPATGSRSPDVIENFVAKVVTRTRKFPLCGAVYHPASNRQMYCSKRCRIAAAALVPQGNGAGNHADV